MQVITILVEVEFKSISLISHMLLIGFLFNIVMGRIRHDVIDNAIFYISSIISFTKGFICLFNKLLISFRVFLFSITIARIIHCLLKDF